MVSNSNGDLLTDESSTHGRLEYSNDDGIVIAVQTSAGQYAMIRVDKLGKIV